MTIEQLLLYIRRDLAYLEGFADAIENGRLTNKVNTIRANLNEFEGKKPVDRMVVNPID